MPTIRRVPRKTVERWEVGFHEAGKRRWRTFGSKEEAEAFAAEFPHAGRGKINRTPEQVRAALAAKSQVDSRGCHVWTGALTNAGYGRLSWRPEGSPRQESGAHRVAYVATYGAVPNGLVIDHLCRNRACVNPEHLEAVTQRENTMRSELTVAFRNASKTHCSRGHEFTPENTRVSVHPTWTARSCRTCEKARSLVAVRRHRAQVRPVTPDPLRGDPYSADADDLRTLIGAFPIRNPKDVTR